MTRGFVNLKMLAPSRMGLNAAGKYINYALGKLPFVGCHCPPAPQSKGSSEELRHFCKIYVHNHEAQAIGRPF
jgi:hypothetical protein